MTLRAKTSLLLAALVLASVAATGLVAINVLEDALRQAVSGGLASIAQSATGTIHGYLAQGLADTRSLGNRLPVDALREQDGSRLDAFLADHSNLLTKFHNGLFILDPAGKLLSDYPPHPKVRGRSFAFRSYFKETVSRGQGVVGQPYRSARTGVPVVTFTAPIFSQQEDLLGVLGCSAQLLRPGALGGLAEIEVGKKGYLYLYDTSRLMILHPDSDRVLQRDVPVGANRLFDAAIDGNFEGLDETVNSRGVAMLLHLNRVEGTDWILGVQQPKAEAFAPLRLVRRSLWVAAGCAVGLSVLAGVLAVGRITAPLERLREAAARLGREVVQGDGDHPGSVGPLFPESSRTRGGDEISDLTSTFQEMVGSLEQTLRSLRGSVREWRHTFDAVPDVICICDQAGQVVRANRAAGQLCGVEPEELTGSTLMEIVGEEDGAAVWARCTDALENAHPAQLEWRYADDQRLFHAQVVPLQGGELADASQGLLFVAEDITQRREFEQALVRTRQRFQELVELLPEMVFEADAEGRLLFVNRRALELTGYQAGELCGGMRLVDLVAATERPVAERELARVATGAEQSSGGEYRFLRKNGDPFSGLLRLAPMAREPGAPAADVRGLIIDVTERKGMESQLRRAGKLEALGQLAGGIAHDFNNLLTPIIGYTELVGEEVDAESRQMLEAVLTAAVRAKDLVEQLLLFSRQSNDEAQTTPVAPVLREAVRFLRASLPATIELRSNITADTGCTRANPSQLQQILVNLGSNAGQALGSNPGHLTLSAEQYHFTGAGGSPPVDLSPGHYVVLRVQDNGPGIDPQLADRIFDPFFTTKTVGEGSGLGLSVVHGVVARLGGAVDVSSQLGQGTCFTVYLPQVEAATSATVLAPVADTDTGEGAHILLVDDEPVVVEFLRQALERFGHDVVATTSSIDALTRFQAAPESFDLVITDQTMPEMTGVSLAREVLRLAPEMPVLLCTGYSHTVTPEMAARESIREYLMKPVSMAELHHAVQRALSPA